MSCEKFKTNRENCLNLDIFTVSKDSLPIAFVQLITDGVILEEKFYDNTNDHKFKISTFANFALDFVEDYSFDMSDYFSCKNEISAKKVKILNPKYCVLTGYVKYEDNWLLVGRKILLNKNNKVFLNQKVIDNFSCTRDNCLFADMPVIEQTGQKILKKSMKK